MRLRFVVVEGEEERVVDERELARLLVERLLEVEEGGGGEDKEG